jgi:hypothetical protein
MKHLIARTLAPLIFVVAGLPLAGQAQVTKAIKANIPFEFKFGDRTFPAGAYILDQPVEHVLVLHDLQGRGIAYLLTEGTESLAPSETTQLKFYSFEGQHILTEVWQQFESSGLQLNSAKPVTNVAKDRLIGIRETAQGNQP